MNLIVCLEVRYMLASQFVCLFVFLVCFSEKEVTCF